MMRATRPSYRQGIVLLAACGALAIASACSDEPGTKYGSPGALRNTQWPKETVPQPEGGTPTVDASCADPNASWSRVVFPALKNEMHCMDAGCHGGSLYEPKNMPAEASAAYTFLTQYTSSGLGKPYIATTGTPGDSGIICNLGFVGTCGKLQMPTAPGVIPAAFRGSLEAWLTCGAPNN